MQNNNMTMGSRTRSLAALSCLATGVLLASSALAQGELSAVEEVQRPMQFSLTAGTTWSDNIALESVDEDEGTFGTLGVGLQYNRESRRLHADVDLNAAYEHYFDNEFDDEVVGGLNGTALLGIVPERFEWLFQDNYGQSRRNALAPVTPDNRESFNLFTTGPDFTLHFGSATSLRLSGRYSTNDYEDAALDGDRYSGALALIRQLSGASAVSLNVQSQRFEYDDPVISLAGDYDRHEAYLRYEVDSSRTRLGLDLGGTRIDRDAGKSDGELVRLELRRQVSASSSILLSAGSEFSDAANELRSEQDLRGVSTDASLALTTADAFRRRYGFGGWAFERNRTSFGFDVEYSEEGYETVTLFDRSIERYDIYASRRLTPNVRLRVDTRYSREDFENLAAKLDELQAIVTLDWAVGRTLSWRLQFDYRDRDSSGAGESDYTENRASLFVSWFPLGRR